MTKTQVLTFAKQNKVEFINVLFTDILGVMKGITIPISKLADAATYDSGSTPIELPHPGRTATAATTAE